MTLNINNSNKEKNILMYNSIEITHIDTDISVMKGEAYKIKNMMNDKIEIENNKINRNSCKKINEVNDNKINRNSCKKNNELFVIDETIDKDFNIRENCQKVKKKKYLFWVVAYMRT